MRPAPRIARERRPNVVLRIGLEDVHDAVLVGERPAEHDEAGVDEPVHEGRVHRSVGLLLERSRRIQTSVTLDVTDVRPSEVA
jgi:hypothetical protein